MKETYNGGDESAERTEQKKLEAQWERTDAQAELDEKLAAAKTMSAIGSALFEVSAHRFDGYVCGMSQGEFQSEKWDGLKGIVERWSSYEGSGSEEDLEVYTNQVTLLDRFPGDTTRRKLDEMLRHYLGIEKNDSYI